MISAPAPSSSVRTSEPSSTPLWCRIVDRLPQRDPDTEWYRPEDLVPLLGIQRRSVYVHCHDLWPKHQGEWRLTYEEVVRLIKRAAFSGKKVRAANAMATNAMSAPN